MFPSKLPHAKPRQHPRFGALLGLVVGCGAPHVGTTRASVTLDAAAGPHNAVPTGRCSTFLRAEQNGWCESTQDQACEYPEGTCVCVVQGVCGGMQSPAASRMGRSCTAKDPTFKREDGCTFNAPTQNGACTKNGETCIYGTCPFTQTSARCTEGAWQVSSYGGPQPP